MAGTKTLKLGNMEPNRKNYFVYIFLFLLWIHSGVGLVAKPIPSTSREEKSLKILTIGNSFANNALEYLAQITESVPGHTVTLARANIGGASLEKHVTLIRDCEKDPGLKPYYKEFCLKDLLQQEQYDIITIQQTSPLSFKEDTYQPHADALIAFIRQLSPQAQIVIHQTWAYSSKCPRLESWKLSRAEMHAGIVKSYDAFARQTNLEMLPSGNAFYRSFQKKPEVYLWKEDGYHANLNGSYLAGCVWFGQLFNVSPKKIRFVPQGMDPQTAKHLREVAAKEVRALQPG